MKQMLMYKPTDLSFRQRNENRKIRSAFTRNFGNQHWHATRNRSVDSGTETSLVKTN